MASSFRTLAGVGVVLVALSLTHGAAQQVPPAKPAAKQDSRPQQEPPPPDQQKPPIFRTGINFVRVDVIVSDKQGGTVADLQQGDFEVTEDGKLQSIETFKLVKLDGGATPSPDGPPKAIRTDYDEEAEAARDDVRLFAIFLDDYHVRRNSSMAARDQIARFVETQLGPSDMVGLMHPLEAVASVRMTRNHSAVVKGIQQFLGRKFDYKPENELEERYAYYPAEIVEQIRNQVSLTAIKSLITHMGSLKEGRKALILVSEGFTNMLPPQMRDSVAAMPGAGPPVTRDPLAGANDPNENRAMFFSGLDLNQDLRDVYDTANRNNTAIYAVDPRGLAPFEFDINEGVGSPIDRQYLTSMTDTLRVLAENSDGRAIVSRNDILGGMKQIVRDSSAYYLIGYNSTQAPSDGKFHQIKVRVKRPGVQVRSRKGYWALSAEDTARAKAPAKPGPPPAVSAALAAVNQPTRARLVRTWIGTSRGENGKTKVTFVWEPLPRPPGERDRSGDAPARVTLTASGVDGSPYFRGRVPDVVLAAVSAGNLAAGAARGPTAASPSRVTFDVQPGKLQLRVSVEGESAQILDTETRDISVPDLTAHTALGTAQVFRARTVREFQLMKADADAVPVAAREFSRTERLLIRVPAYGPGSKPPAVTARLLNRAGQPMSELPVASSATATGEAQIDLSLAGLAGGEYIVEVKAESEGGEVKELVGFRIVA